MAWEKTIGVLETEIRDHWRDWDVYQAFTGRRIIEKWHEQGLHILNEIEALELLRQQRYERIMVLPTHLTFGKEYTQVIKAVESVEKNSASIKVGLPLLGNTVLISKVVCALIKELSVQENEEMVLVGHGNRRNGCDVYEILEEELRRRGQCAVTVGTLENVDKLLNRVRMKNVRLVPLMLTAGKHALQDITGKQEGSVAMRFSELGCKVVSVEKGLGEYESIRKVYMEELDELINS